jgi:hypothetical protein
MYLQASPIVPHQRQGRTCGAQTLTSNTVTVQRVHFIVIQIAACGCWAALSPCVSIEVQVHRHNLDFEWALGGSSPPVCEGGR